ncbi:MAG TPA: hypothetical protein ENH82_19800 [bacterium]|nr:hypothetical protein [bacterium]
MNVLTQIWNNNGRVTRDYIPCRICGKPTRMHGTKMCDGCWEVESRLSSFLACKNAVDFVQGELDKVSLSKSVKQELDMPSYDKRTIENTMLCVPCDNVFVEDDDYDTAGSVSGVCCPDCGGEKFVSLKDILMQYNDLLVVCVRMMVGITKNSTKDCEWYESSNAVTEAEKLITEIGE